MPKLYKNFLWVVLILFGLTILTSSTYEPAKPSGDINLSQLAEKINAGGVEKIIVAGNDLEVHTTGEEILRARKEPEAGLTETLSNLKVSASALSGVEIEVKEESTASFWLGILIPTLLPLLIIIGIIWFTTQRAKGGMNQAFSFGRANVKRLQASKDRVTFNDVAGLKEAKQELAEIVDFLKSPKKYLDIGAKIPRGVLLMGYPGTGKTLLARAVAGEANVPFFHISASEFVEMFVGVGAARVRDLFETAKKAAPAIIFIDEIDAIGRERGTGLGGGHDEREQTLNQILVEMDGFERDTKLIVMAATNRADVLDSALLRPGRFDRRIILDAPDISERESILKLHAKNKPLETDVDLRKIAQRTPGFSGADLANLLNEAAIFAAQKNKKTVNHQDVLDSIEKVMLGPARSSRIVSPKQKEITAYHEAGHSLVAASLKESDPVHKVSIVARGNAGGYTLKLPSEDNNLKTKSQFMADLAVMMGGYVAEKLTFGDLTTGASNDLENASSLARALVTRYGMSEKIGPLTFGKTNEMSFLGRNLVAEKSYSEAMAIKIDEEVRKFIDDAHKTAIKIITSRKKLLKEIANALIEKETLEQEEFYALIGDLKPILR
ncbi:MAG: cell division protein FtsH [Candidatus Colwellbacteria bacterium RIFCSPLOWO2_01_FULL_48_10]|uniref:ATP-dependent zinc metalloprotease FtsH n=1 Tax=Candidatus Colwellbacteria bacterium RIFCSPLOWO2_01_FULL_48_10 TaxID=1797690 RepID=A0A1G1Z9U3_9BACT|nr:MAG: cell division protein FtsH [Candidatus Colwellbacteria bacterium RIFCSPLOWO2_01_FULL_48_10]